MRLALLILIQLVPASGADLVGFYNQLRNASLDPTRIAVAENVILRKDAATFQFKTGLFHALEPVMGRVVGVVFTGNGIFSMEPPGELEQKHLVRLADKQPRIEEPFREAVLLFSDSTFAELSALASFKPGTVDAKAAGTLTTSRKIFRETLKTNVEARLLAGLTWPGEPLFLADIYGQKHGKLLFLSDPTNGESISTTHYDGTQVSDVWTSYNPVGLPSAEQRTLVHTTRVEVKASVDKRGRLEAETISEFTGQQDGPLLLSVPLAPTLRVSKVVDSKGTALQYIQEAKDKDADFWVILPEPLVRGTMYSWRIAYAGDGVIRQAGDGNFFVGERERWYPKIDGPLETFNDRATYHLKFRNPQELTLVATGKLIDKHVDGKTAVSEWETEAPYSVAGFNYGEYKAKTVKTADQTITVYANTQLGDELKRLKLLLEQNPELARANGITTGGLNTTGLIDQTLAESANSLRVFTTYFGPLPFQSISITQQAAGNFGQSWPTLIFMPYTSFLDSTTRHQLRMDQGRTRQFFDEVGSHEIAHQWWGHLVGWRDYHDQWLSEGFAQFSAGLYLQVVQGEKNYKSFLEADRQFIMSPLRDSTMKANDAGPIWMGFRLSTEKSSEAYRLIYAKGAFVLHMLRMLMYDYVRHDDSRFIAMMRDFVQTYRGKSASTEDFKKICDKHFETDMSWFFQQWVYGTDIPKVSIEYRVVNTPEGPLLSVDAEQHNVPETFRSILPLILHYKSGASAGRVTMSKPQLHAELRLKERPESVEFNPLYGLLCELEVKKR